MEIGPPEEHIDICRFDEHITSKRALSEILRHGSGPQRYFSPTVQGTFLTLPGTGQPGSDCGDPVPWMCRDDGKVFFVEHSCGERQCPHCSHRWVKDRAAATKGRLWDGRDYWRDMDGKEDRVHHIIVSLRVPVPEDRDSYRNLRQLAITLGKEAGIRGGCAVFHAFRESDPGVFDVPGPHFHIFGLGGWIKGLDEIEPYTDDIIVKRVEDFDARQMEPFEYVFSHCSIPEGHHAVVWFGNLAYNKMQRGPQERAASAEAEPQPQICPRCGGTNTYYIPVPYGYQPQFWIEPKEM